MINLSLHITPTTVNHRGHELILSSVTIKEKEKNHYGSVIGHHQQNYHGQHYYDVKYDSRMRLNLN